MARLSKRHNRNGSVSPRWPSASRAFGKRSKMPPKMSRKACEAVSTPTPSRARQTVVARKHRERRHRISGMQIDERAERLSPLPKRVKLWIVEILAGLAIDQGAAELQVLNAPLQFVGRRGDILHGQMGETRIAIGPLLDLAGEKFVGFAGLTDRGRGIAFDLHAGTGEGENRTRYAGAVHGAQALFAKIDQPAMQLALTAGSTSVTLVFQ